MDMVSRGDSRVKCLLLGPAPTVAGGSFRSWWIVETAELNHAHTLTPPPVSNAHTFKEYSIPTLARKIQSHLATDTKVRLHTREGMKNWNQVSNLPQTVKWKK